MEERTDAFEMAEANVDTESIKCKGCGSNLVFDPETQMLKCNYCDTTERFEQSSAVMEIAIADALSANAVWSDEALVYNCENCGARIVAETAETAALCPFCGTSHVVAEEDLQGIKPNSVVPFAFGKEKLLTYLKGWAKRKLLAPGDFKKNVKADKVKGVYMPFFTFDSNTESVYEGRLGYRKTRTVKTKNGTRTETYIVWRNVSGTIGHFFNDMLVNAGKRFDSAKMESLAPFDWTAAKRYESKFLSGFVAHRYEKSIEDCWGEARTEMDSAIRRMIVNRHHADEVGYLNVSTRHENVTYKYVLLPVYVINYDYKSKNYVIYANGTTGKIVGKSPVSVWKAILAGVIGAAALAGIILLLYYFMVA